MKYLLLFCLLILTIAASAPVFAQVTVPSPHCLGSCKTQTSANNNGTNTVSLGPSTATSGTPSNSPTNPSAAPSTSVTNPSPSTSPCSSGGSSLSSQSTGTVSAMHYHGKWHHHGKRGFLQNFMQLLLQLLQQLFQKLGININIPNTNPCGTNSSPSTAPSNSPSAAPSSGAGGSGGTISGTPSSSPGGNPSPTVFGTSPAPSTQPGGTTSTGFIGVSGSKLTLNGKPYKSVGYGFSAVGACWSSDWTTSQMDTFFSNLPKDSMARFFAPPNDVSASFVQSVVKEADKYSIHLIIALADADVDNNCDTEDASGGGKTAAYYTNAVQAGSPYANWVKSVVTPLANDPGVAMWEIVNEPWHKGASFSQVGQTAAVNYVNAAATLIRNAETAGAGKPKQLITLGTVDIGETGGVSGMEAIFKNLDVVNDHDYSGDQGGSTQYLNGEFPQLQQVAQALGKPYMVDETGVEAGASCSSSNVQNAWDNGSAGLSLQNRVNFLLTQKATSYLKSGASYVGFWLYTGNGGGCSYENIYPSDPLMSAVKNYQVPN